MRATLAGEPADVTLALVRPALDSGALDAEPDSRCGIIALFTLIANDRARRRRSRACDALIDAARPRGWLIALAHGQLHARDRARARRTHPRRRGRRAPVASTSSSPQRRSSAALVAVPARRRARRARRARRCRRRPGGSRPAGRSAGRRAGRPAAAAEPRRLRLAQHRPDDALADARAAAAVGRARHRATPASPAGASTPPRRSSRSATPVSARELADEHLALADRLGLPGPTGAGLRALARAASIGRADRRCSNVPSPCWRDSPNRLEHARALVDLGAALRRANRRADARAPLRRALDLAERGGMRRLAHRARHELAPPAPARAEPRCPGRRAHPRRAPRRRARRRAAQQPRDRPAALRHPAHRRDPPDARLPEARHREPRRARRRLR